MSVIYIELNRLLIGAERLCTSRNRSLPVELGKSLYEACEGGVVFSQAHYLLDSSHSDYTNDIACVIFDELLSCWSVMVPLEGESESDSVNWGPYPYLAKSKDLDAILSEIEKDPKSYFWS
ncbi:MULTISPECIES: DUF3024 domain-containing protein [Vibrio]|uniref:DUF3024 domain-containing protein n=1 Tax=Vibrio splendidus TaxID=29497 RepID=A0A2N7JPX1_VIBSP|nr:DUF3024 domain-containing protein [Vibrio splendidus]PMM50212.1 hypothetical protein BCT54_24495 [Vibrio splendidus]